MLYDDYDQLKKREVAQHAFNCKEKKKGGKVERKKKNTGLYILGPGKKFLLFRIKYLIIFLAQNKFG